MLRVAKTILEILFYLWLVVTAILRLLESTIPQVLQVLELLGV